MALVVGIWGNDKTGKTSLALTFPKPIYYMELDLGGFDRAKSRFQDDVDKGLIIYKRFIVPMQGSLDEVTLRPSKIITGVKESWYEIINDLVNNVIKKPNVATCIIDTGTLLYELDCTGYLQEKQEVQLDSNGNLREGEKSLRVSLLPIEYREPYIRMRGLIYHIRAMDKNVILTHHSRDEYKARMNPKTGQVEEAKTGNKERAGYGPLGDSTNLMLHTYKKDGVFHAKIDEESVPPGIIGVDFTDPTYDKIMETIKMVNGGK